MAIIECPDCGREISSEAPACLGCGRPIKVSKQEGDSTIEEEARDTSSDELQAEVQEDFNKAKKCFAAADALDSCSSCSCCIGLILGALFLAIVYLLER